MSVRRASFEEGNRFLPRIIPHPWRVRDQNPTGLFLYNPGLRATLIVSVMWYTIRMHEELWLHVSMAVDGRTPTWKELEEVRIWTCGADSFAFQVHAPRREWVNDHEFALHLFSPIDDRERRLPDFRHEYEPGRFTL